MTPGATMTIEAAAAALRVRQEEVRARAEPYYRGFRGWRLASSDKIIALTDGECEQLNAQAGFRRWAICEIGTHAGDEHVRRALQRADREEQPRAETIPERPRKVVDPADLEREHEEYRALAAASGAANVRQYAAQKRAANAAAADGGA